MLSPDDLITLHEALRPPLGHRLDVAVGTTYSLDLLALLGPPVAFAMFDLQQADDPAQLGGLAVLESVRRHADAITVFCQAGQIAVPSAYRQAITWTEGAVIEVRRPAPGFVFHPKSWTLRFTNDAGSLRHRVIVLSRNLTFDRSWDVVITLDEDEGAAAGAAARHGQFLLQLPDLAASASSLSRARRAAIDDLASTVAAARLAPPKPFTSVELWPLGGAAGAGWPYPNDPQKSLIVSPFLTESTLQSIGRRGTTSLVSTTRAIDALESATVRSLDCWVLATAPADDTAPAGPPVAPGPTLSPSEDTDGNPADSPVGLHAKIVLSEPESDPSACTWVAGSANATHNAHHGNIELVVRMQGPWNSCGVAALLEPNPGDRDRSVLRDMIEPYSPGPDEVDPDADTAENLLDSALIDLAVAGCVLTVGDRMEDGRFPLTASFAALPAGVGLQCRPVTYGPELARVVDSRTGEAQWDAVTLQALTPYVVVTAEVSEPLPAIRSRVLVATLVGAPAHRRERTLAEMLRSAEDFMRYLLLLLGSTGDDEAWATAVTSLIDGDPGGSFGQGGTGESPILETLLRAAAHYPEVLRHVEALVADLRRAGVGPDVIPASFDAVWDALSLATAGGARR